MAGGGTPSISVVSPYCARPALFPPFHPPVMSKRPFEPTEHDGPSAVSKKVKVREVTLDNSFRVFCSDETGRSEDDWPKTSGGLSQLMASADLTAVLPVSYRVFLSHQTSGEATAGTTPLECWVIGGAITPPSFSRSALTPGAAPSTTSRASRTMSLTSTSDKPLETIVCHTCCISIMSSYNVGCDPEDKHDKAVAYDPIYRLSSSVQDVSLEHRPVVY
jgi:hypothetical protein